MPCLKLGIALLSGLTGIACKQWSAVPCGIQKPLLETVDLRENYSYLLCMYKDKRAKFIFSILADIRRDEGHSLQPGKAR